MRIAARRLLIVAFAAFVPAAASAQGPSLDATPAEREAAFLELAKTAEQVLVLVEELRQKNATLTTRVAELTDLLDMERHTTTELRTAQSQLSSLLGEAKTAQNDTALRLKATQDQAGQLALRIKEFEERATLARLELESRDRRLSATQEDAVRLALRLKEAEEHSARTQRDLESRDLRLKEIENARLRTEEQANGERRLSAEAQSQVQTLNLQLAALRRQFADIEAALEVSKQRDKESQATILDLGRRLNVALAEKVQELARYRSEFFGRLRESLGDRADMRVVGDRFVFQSEVLFAPGSADLGQDARTQLNALARALADIARKIPTDLDWILRVDGHTDTVPIRSRDFPSNWELSTARALAVTKYLIAQGVPPMRVAAAGFGEYHPLDARSDEIGFRRNRRIEFKLTEQ